MKKLWNRFTKEYPLFNVRELELEDKLSVIFLLTGLILSTFGFITTILLQQEFWKNIPNLLCMILCITLPIVLRKNLLKGTVIALLVIGLLYFPFLYFTNGGNDGSGPYYFIMITIYYAFYLRGKKLVLIELFVITFYVCLIFFGYSHPEYIISYSDRLSKTIDITIAIVSISIAVSIVANSSFTSYKKEHSNSIALMNQLVETNKQLLELSNKDTLTNLYNRRCFMQKLNMLVEGNDEFYLLMIDIDDFKIVNDTYGHLFGDTVLKRISHSIQSTVRDHDIVARYGGEEIAVILTNSTHKQAIQIAERIRLGVESLEYRYDISATISIGLAKYQNTDTTGIINAADEMLYKAKAEGKNKVVY